MAPFLYSLSALLLPPSLQVFLLASACLHLRSPSLEISTLLINASPLFEMLPLPQTAFSFVLCSTSSQLGTASIAPLRSTAMPAAVVALWTACATSRPRIRLPTKKPRNVSPAPVVSLYEPRRVEADVWNGEDELGGSVTEPAGPRVRMIPDAAGACRRGWAARRWRLGSTACRFDGMLAVSRVESEMLASGSASSKDFISPSLTTSQPSRPHSNARISSGESIGDGLKTAQALAAVASER